jgi:hypothetical protein
MRSKKGSVGPAAGLDVPTGIKINAVEFRKQNGTLLMREAARPLSDLPTDEKPEQGICGLKVNRCGKENHR